MTLTRMKRLIGYKGAGVVVTAPDPEGRARVLLGQRLFRPYAGYWSLPGGGMEEGDGGNFRACAARELFEETVGLAKLGELQARFEQRLAASPEHRVRWPFCFDYRTYVLPLAMIPDLRLWPNGMNWAGEFERFYWFEPDRLPHPMHPFVRDALKSFVSST